MRWRKSSDLKSPVTLTKARLAIQLATRHSKLSAATNETRIAKASHGLPPCPGSRDRTSTRNLTPYCVLTEQVTAPSTARMMTP